METTKTMVECKSCGAECEADLTTCPNCGEEMETTDTTERSFKTQTAPMLEVRAMIKPQSFNKAERTMDVVFATDAPVRMWSWEEGHYLEKLDMKGMRADRLNSGAPLLDNHDSYQGTKGVLGAVVRGTAKTEGNVATATVKFSQRDEVQSTIQDVEDGILNTLSVGYNVYRAELTGTVDGVKSYTATDWEPFEISLAPIPADFKAQVRQGQTLSSTVEIETDLTPTTHLVDDAKEWDKYTRNYYELIIK